MVINCGYKLFNWMAYHHYEYRNCHYFIWISLIISQNGKYLFSYQHTVLVLVTEENDDSDNLRYCKPIFICDQEIFMRFARAWFFLLQISSQMCLLYYFQDNLNLDHENKSPQTHFISCKSRNKVVAKKLVYSKRL